MIRINSITPNTNTSDKRRRHQGRANCEVAGRRFETKGPAPIYRMATLLWLHGHIDAYFAVYDDRSPTGGPGGLALTGRVRNWARFVTGKPTFGRDAPSEVDFSPHERGLIARTAGSVAEIDSPRPENGRPAAVSIQDASRCLAERDGAPVPVSTAAHPGCGVTVLPR